MDRSLRWRTIGLVAIVSFCVLALLPSVFDKSQLPSWYGKFFDTKIQLGLDLQGGLHTVYSIDLDKAVEDKAGEIKRDVEAYLIDEKVEGTASTPRGKGAVTVRVDAEHREAVAKWLKSTYSNVIVDRPCDEGEADAICVRVSSDYADSIKRAALQQAIETIRDRIDSKGVAEPTVITKGDDIVVELPGLDEENISKIKDIIARTAKLEFRRVIENDPWMVSVYAEVKRDPQATKLGIEADNDSWRHDDSGKTYDDYFLLARDEEQWVPTELAKEIGCWEEGAKTDGDNTWCGKNTGRLKIVQYVAALADKDAKFKVPDDRELGFEYITPPKGAEDTRPFWRTYLLSDSSDLTGSSITNAMKIWDPQTNRPEVLVEFNRYGTQKFADLTTQSVGKKMAIVLDGSVKSAPVIQAKITGGRSNISMGGGDGAEQDKEADALVTVLKTGSLPAPLKEESSALLGPTLGQDAIAKTQFSFILGTILVIVTMLTIYRFSGLLSIIALTINITMTLAAMGLFGATLTLPGIAAIVLTVGMAVDGNILIYERIRDELHAGKSVRGAVDIGFARAFSAILDGQLTTAAAGWVLLQYGSGPIQGFATMLLVGIGATLFTTTWVTRLFFDWYLQKNKGAETLSI